MSDNYKTTLRPKELRIIGALVRSLIRAGNLVGVRDEEEAVIKPSALYNDIINAIAHTDLTFLDVYSGRVVENGKPGPHIGFIKLVHGEDCGVIQDYTFALDKYLEDADTIAHSIRTASK